MTDLSLQALILRAAVTGPFAPEALLEGLPAARHDELIGDLSLLCDEAPGEDGRRWLLTAAARREALSALDSPSVVKAVLDTAPASTGDVFGATLRALLSGAALGIPLVQEVDGAIEAERHAALQFARLAPVVDREACDAAFARTRARIAGAQQDEALRLVLPDRLFGRAAQLRRIRDWLAHPEADPRPLPITGIGGVGKSALVAAVVRGWTRSGGPAVLIDFDRDDLAGGEPLAFMREFLRQAETAWLAVEQGQPQRLRSEAAAAARARLQDLSFDPGIKAGEQFSIILSSVVPAFEGLPEADRTAPLLLVLDSFEVVAGLGDDVFGQLVDLERLLRLEAGLAGLRTIVSGRECAPPDQSPTTALSADTPFGPRRRWVKVGGLAPAAGADFLRSRDTQRRFPDRPEQERIVRTLGGHPLAIIVLERYARERSPDEVARLVRDLEQDEAFSAEFAQTFVYTRILDRIRDEDVRKLAHPGLILRQVTADLIRLVLASPCGLGPVDQARSSELLAKLQGEYWLVERLGGGVLRHRPDLRRLMLPGMFAGPRASDGATDTARKTWLQAASRAACEAAATFYQHGPPPTDRAYGDWARLTRRQREVEATYYRALAGAQAPSELERGDAADLRNILGADLDSLPLPWRAVIRASAGDVARLSDAERETLTGSLREVAEEVSVEAKLRAGSTAGAEAQSLREAQRRGQRGRDALAPIDQAVRSAFEAARFAEVTERVQALIRAFDDGLITPATDDKARDGRFWDTGLWQGVLTMVAIGDEPSLDRRRLGDALQGLLPDGLRPAALLLGVLSRRLGPLEPFSHGLTEDQLRQPWRTAGAADPLRSLGALISSGIAPHKETPIPGAALALGDPQVLEMLRRETAPTIQFPDRQELARFDARSREGGFTTDDLERLYRSAATRPALVIGVGGAAAMQTKGPFWRLLRGLTPELHGPTTQLLRGLTSPALILRIAEATAQSASHWPADLWFEGAGTEAPGRRVARRRFNPRHAQLIVRTADRCGVLADLLKRLAEVNDRARHLQRMHELITERFFRPRGG